MDRDEIIRLLEAKGLLKGKDVGNLTDGDLRAMLREALQEGHDQGGGPFIEAQDAPGGKYLIRAIRAGESLNGNFYPDRVLREAVPLFDGVRVFSKADDVHLQGKGKDAGRMVGVLSEPSFVEGKGPDTGEIQAVLTVISPSGNMGIWLREAFERGMTGHFGFSIDAAGTARVMPGTNKQGRKGALREALKITKVKSVDLIVDPGAGGQVIQLIESAQDKDPIMERELLIRLLEAKGLLKGKNVEKLTDDELNTMFAEAVDAAEAEKADAEKAEAEKDKDLREAKNDDNSDGDDKPATRADVRMVEARANARTLIDASKLPQAAKDRLQSRFAAEASFTEAEVKDAIKDEADYLASFTESGTVQGLGGARTSYVEGPFEKTQDMLEAFFDREHKDHRHAQSFKECYTQITGDRRVTGRVEHCDSAQLREALGDRGGFVEAIDTSTFSVILGDSIRRAMIKDYRKEDQYGIWRHAADVVPVSDFRTNHRTRYGGYGDLPIVDEGDPYAALTSPSDEEATYAIAKRGGTEKVTLETIRNDDVGVIRRIPTNMSRSSKRTLSKFVLDFMRTNPAIYDTVALFHGTHSNLGSAALADATWAAARLAMINQPELDGNDTLGIAPRNLWVPPALEETAFNMFRKDTNNDETFVQSQKPRVLVPWYWTDANDWVATADVMDVPFIEIAFLDGNEEPEIFVQDNPNQGSLFSNDQITYKVRHPYGGTVVDYRGAYKAVVA